MIVCIGGKRLHHTPDMNTNTTLQANSRQRARALAARAIAKAVREERPNMTSAERRALVLQFLDAMVF
jgi:hypothetical protein